jgi:thioester reductase-like protein
VKHILLTGATGLVGQYLVRDLLMAGAPLAVLIRSQDKEPASRRLRKVLDYWQGKLRRPMPRPVCLEGDVTRDGLGLTREARDWAACNCDRLLHNAASLTFAGSDRAGEPWRSNLAGTAHLLGFCRHTGLKQFHHVSTAYVCGKREGIVYENDLDCGQEFRNDYEHSKCEAEKLLRATDFLERVTVYRPAVIVGDSRTGYTSTYHGLYSFMHIIWMLRQYVQPEQDGRYYYPMRLKGTGEEPRNLVPVDWVSAVITHLVLSPQHHGRTFHLTPDEPVKSSQLQDWVSDYFNYHGPVFVGPDALATAELTEREKTIYKHVERYEPYWDQEPLFDNRNTRAAAPHLPCPRLDREFLHRLVDFAIHDGWGRKSESAERADQERPEPGRRKLAARSLTM